VIWCIIVAVLAFAIHFLQGRKCVGTLAVRTNGGSEVIESIFNEYSIAYDLKYKNMDEVSDLLYEFRYRKGINKIVAIAICERIMLLEGVTSVKFVKM